MVSQIGRFTPTANSPIDVPDYHGLFSIEIFNGDRYYAPLIKPAQFATLTKMIVQNVPGGSWISHQKIFVMGYFED